MDFVQIIPKWTLDQDINFKLNKYTLELCVYNMSSADFSVGSTKSGFGALLRYMSNHTICQQIIDCAETEPQPQ